MKGIAAILVFATASVAAPLQAADDVSLNANDIKWGPAPPVLPKGARSRCSTATRSSRVPTRYASGHTQAEDLTIISGALYLGMGDKMDT